LGSDAECDRALTKKSSVVLARNSARSNHICSSTAAIMTRWSIVEQLMAMKSTNAEALAEAKARERVKSFQEAVLQVAVACATRLR